VLLPGWMVGPAYRQVERHQALGIMGTRLCASFEQGSHESSVAECRGAMQGRAVGAVTHINRHLGHQNRSERRHEGQARSWNTCTHLLGEQPLHKGQLCVKRRVRGHLCGTRRDSPQKAVVATTARL